MPFAVFRRHQRKLLAVFALLAMFGFVVGGTLPQLLSGRNQGGADGVVATIYGKPLYRSEVAQLANERATANQFMAALYQHRLFPYPNPAPFGALDTRSIVDLAILRHEADALGIPASVALARDWLKEMTAGALDDRAFNQILEENFRDSVGGERLLTIVADQYRALTVLNMYAGSGSLVTPLDLFETYRDEQERVSAHLVRVPVAEFVKAVGEPTDADVRALYDKYKDVLPDPDLPTPGFKVPRRIRLEIVSADAAKRAEEVRKTLTDKELRAELAERKADPEAYRRLRLMVREGTDLPIDLFAGDPEAKLTPLSFARARATLATSLADRKAREAIAAKFSTLIDKVLSPYGDAYDNYIHPAEGEDGKAPAPQGPPPPAPDLAAAAKAQGLEYEKTPPLTRAEAEEYGQIHSARIGASNDDLDQRNPRGTGFAQEVFEARRPLFEPLEFSDELGRRYLVWKVEDVAEHVPTLEQAREDVVAAWKTEKARVPARAAAEAIRKKAEAAKGELTKAVVGDRPIVTTREIARMTPATLGPARPQEIAEVPHAGTALREAYFGLRPGVVVVEPDAPQTTYYVMNLADRTPAGFATFIMPMGPMRDINYATRLAAQDRSGKAALAALRARAGLPADWTPPDDANRRGAAETPVDEE